MRLTKLYAEALYQAAHDDEEAVQLLEELELAQEVLAPFQDFVAWVDLQPDAFSAIRESLTDEFSTLTLNLLEILAEDGLLSSLESVINEYEIVLVENDALYLVTVESARPLTDELKAQIEALIEERFGKSYELEYQIEPALIGGIRVKANHAIIDTTFRSRLSRIKEGV